ncbi:T9SS type A sorting domain-containing protein [Aquimarina sp. 2201CG1-2-11]|uniref:T9SS type A sorting domain-containing protein n=1 Tax=Aquimarina discodermiae TaxID=3231043 RepID=UPI00346225FD
MNICQSISSQEIEVTSIGSTRGTAYAMQNKILTVVRDFKSFSYFTYLEEITGSNDRFNVKILEYNNLTSDKRYLHVAEITQDLGLAQNPHGTSSITLDNEGYLHVVFGPHHGDLRYRKSKNSLYDSSLTFLPEETIPSLKSQDFRTKDKWTYPIIKVDNSGTIHISGSLDAQFTDNNGENNNGDGEDDRDAKDIGYIRKKKNGNWEYPLSPVDPLGDFNPNNFVRYDVMMNIDNVGNIHILAPDSNHNDKNPDEPSWYLDYHYFKSNNGGDSFDNLGLAWEYNNQTAQGKANIAFDSNNNPHFTIVAGGKSRSERIYYNYYNGTSWENEEIEIENKYLHEPKIRIDTYGQLYISFYGTNNSGWTSTGTVRYLAHKDLYDPNSELEITMLNQTSRSLNWIPTLEENNDYENLNKNWSYTMWQQNDNGVPSQKQTIYSDKIIPCNFTIPDQIYIGFTDFKARKLLNIGDSTSLEQPTNKSIVANNSNASYISGKRIKFSAGFSVQRGAKFHASIDPGLNKCDDRTIVVNRSNFKSENLKEDLILDQKTGFVLYPNPNNGKFIIEVPASDTSNGTKIKVFDIHGKLIFYKKHTVNQIDVDLTTFLSGIYFINISTDKITRTKKILINK